MNAMQKSLMWVADKFVKTRHENPRPADCVAAIDVVVRSVLFRATPEDQRIATRALLKRYGTPDETRHPWMGGRADRVSHAAPARR
jgi:hypothetical protein